MLKLTNISKSYVKDLFHKVNFVLGNSEKVGLVGLNGCGKSTLLKIIGGHELPDEGSVEIANEVIAYLPQEFDITHANGQKLEFFGEYIESLVEFDNSKIWIVKKLLAKISLEELDEFAQLSSLSPGQHMKLYLAKLLVNEPTVLLMDEPTNHLDIEGIEWLEDFVSSYEGICIIISHDREFLNNVTDKTFEIEEGSLNIYEGNYDDYIEEKARRLEERAKQYHLQEKHRKKIENMIELFRKQSSGEAQARKLKAAKKRLEREVLRNEVQKYRKEEVRNLSLDGSVHNRKRILEIKNLDFSYPVKEIFSNANLEIFGNEKVWVKGRNGSGKSTLIKLINEELEPKSGTLKWGANLSVAYFRQNIDLDHVTDTVQEYFFKSTKCSWDQTFGHMDNLNFDESLRSTQVRKLSPGQKSRLTFGIFAMEEYDCMILDEPTNHLDIETKQVIENALREFKGALIYVSHDRYFAHSIQPTMQIEIIDQKIVIIA